MNPLEGDACCADDGAEAVQTARERTRQRNRAVRRVFIVALVLNTLVAASKAAYGYISGSLSLGTDSLHSILDAGSNILALFGLQWAARPADARHPYGRQKIEILAALGIGVLIVIALYEFAEAAVRGLITHRAAPRVGWAGYVIVGATMAVSWFVSRYEHRKGHELGSALLHADAHHTRSDFYAGAAVLASFVAARFGIAWADSLATLLLVVLIGHVAWEVFHENVPVLIDAAMLDPATVVALARGVEGVSDVHRVRSRGIRSAVELDLHLEVAPEMSVGDAHRLGQQIERELKLKFPELSDVVIHVEPRTHATVKQGPEPPTSLPRH
jgi:cation diffusion facilitator family transporter